jgi:hypothetical protein
MRAKSEAVGPSYGGSFSYEQGTAVGVAGGAFGGGARRPLEQDIGGLQIGHPTSPGKTVSGGGAVRYRGTWLIRKRTLVGPYCRRMSRVLGGS